MILENFPLGDLNTFGVRHAARFYSAVDNTDDLSDLLLQYKDPRILGGGSNILLTQDLDGLVIRNELMGIEVTDEDNDHVWVEVNSGENWHQFVQWAVIRGWGGVENLSLIPGTVGAAPIQNIGAYGVELKDVLVRVVAMELKSGRIISFTAEECRLSYRHSLFKMKEYKNQYFILSIMLKLSKNPLINTRYADLEKKLNESAIKNPGIAEIHRAIIEIRQNKLPDPAILGNAGSFFKNPIISMIQFESIKVLYPQLPHYPVDDKMVKLPAGWLIDRAGWKGKRVGRVGCYEKQALVIVNAGGATGQEIWDFAKMVQEDIAQKFGILMEPEINIW